MLQAFSPLPTMSWRCFITRFSPKLGLCDKDSIYVAFYNLSARKSNDVLVIQRRHSMTTQNDNPPRECILHSNFNTHKAQDWGKKCKIQTYELKILTSLTLPANNVGRIIYVTILARAQSVRVAFRIPIIAVCGPCAGLSKGYNR